MPDSEPAKHHMDPKEIHDSAMEDSTANEYNPPHDTGVLSQLTGSVTDKDIEENKSYTEQWRANRDNMS